MLLNIINVIYLLYVRPFIKWFLHRYTNLCELQRLCYGLPAGAERTKAIENALQLSKNKKIQQILAAMDVNNLTGQQPEEYNDFNVRKSVAIIMQEKHINSMIHPDFSKFITQCTNSIWGNKYLYQIVENLRITQYDCDNISHEKKLYELWNLLMPECELQSRITKQWQDIGFQGDDPKTDFRGMGILGLENLLYFAREYNGAARHVLSHSHHPVHGYTFAIVGINLTSMTYHLLRYGAAKTHIYNLLSNRLLDINVFHKLYCYLFYEFDKYWMLCKPTSIMDFSHIQEKFQANILQQLKNNQTLFKINLSIENV